MDIRTFEEKKLEKTKTIHNYLKENISVLDSYDLKDVYLKTIKKIIDRKYKISIPFEFLNKKYRYDSCLTEESLWNLYYNEEILKYGTIEEYQLCKNFNPDLRYVNSINYDKDKQILKFTYSSRYWLSYMLYFLQYVTTGTIEKDYEKTDNLKKKYFSEFSSDNPGKFDFKKISELDNIEIKRFLNDNYVIKNFSESSFKRFQEIITLLEIK